jgi:hypothetical protein
MTRLRYLFALFVLIAGFAPGLAGATPPSGAVPATFFGMHLIDKNQWPTIPVDVLYKGTFVAWPYIELTQGNRDWSNMDAWVAQAQAHGVPHGYTFWGSPPWAVADQSTCASAYGYVRCTGMPDLTALDNFVTALVQRYAGKIFLWELWNEPYNNQPGNEGWSGTPAQLATVTQHIYNIIRANDPTALIGSQTLGSTTFDNAYFAAGGTKNFDVVAFHAYPDPSRYTTSQYPAAERICCGNFLIAPVKSTITTHGLGSKPIFDTEGSWGQHQGVMLTNDPDRMAFVARWHLLHWSEGVQRMAWYAWDNSAWGTLWNGTPNAAAGAYAQVRDWMVGATMPSSCATSGTNAINTDEAAQYACTLTRPGGYQALAIWNTNGSTSYTPSGIYTQFRDLSGTKTTFTPGTARTIGFKPILLETGDPPSGSAPLAPGNLHVVSP